jgi:hypothetical protein
VSTVHGTVPRLLDARHSAKCSVCALDLAQLAELELAWLAWDSDAQLAELFGVVIGAPTRHARWYSLDLVRYRRTQQARARLVERGLRDLDADDERISVDAQLLLETLAEIDDNAPAGPAIPEAGDTSWEAMIQLRGSGPMPQLGQPGERRQLGEVHTVDVDQVDDDGQARGAAARELVLLP